MELNEDEKKCLRLLTKWSQAGKVDCQADEVMTKLGVDDDTYVDLVKKIDEIGVISYAITGRACRYESFKIKDFSILRKVCQRYGIEIA